MKSKYISEVGNWSSEFPGLGQGVEGEFNTAKAFVEKIPALIDAIIQKHKAQVQQLKEALGKQGSEIQGEMGTLRNSNTAVVEEIAKLKGGVEQLSLKVDQLEQMLETFRQAAIDSGYDMGEIKPAGNAKAHDELGFANRQDTADKEGIRLNKVDPKRFMDKAAKLLEDFKSAKDKYNAEAQKASDLLSRNKGLQDDKEDAEKYINALEKVKNEMYGVINDKIAEYSKLESAHDAVLADLTKFTGAVPKSGSSTYTPNIGQPKESVDPDYLRNYGTFNLMEYLETNYKSEKKKS